MKWESDGRTAQRSIVLEPSTILYAGADGLAESVTYVRAAEKLRISCNRQCYWRSECLKQGEGHRPSNREKVTDGTDTSTASTELYSSGKLMHGTQRNKRYQHIHQSAPSSSTTDGSLRHVQNLFCPVTCLSLLWKGVRLRRLGHSFYLDWM